LLPLTEEAHQENKTDLLNRIYQFAEWCWKQERGAPDIYNAVAVAFYEHLVDEEASRKAIPYWLKPRIFQDVLPLLKHRINNEEYQDLLKHYNVVNHTTFE